MSLFFLLFVNFVHCVEFNFIRNFLLWKQQILIGRNCMIFLCWRCGLYNLVMFNKLSFGVDLYIVGNLFLFFICQLLILIISRIKSLSACYLLTESYSWDIKRYCRSFHVVVYFVHQKICSLCICKVPMFSTKISLHNLSLLEFKIDAKLNSISFIRISLVYSEKKDSLKTNFESLEFLHSCTLS